LGAVVAESYLCWHVFYVLVFLFRCSSTRLKRLCIIAGATATAAATLQQQQQMRQAMGACRINVEKGGVTGRPLAILDGMHNSALCFKDA
jgi:hypothetical protein